MASFDRVVTAVHRVRARVVLVFLMTGVVMTAVARAEDFVYTVRSGDNPWNLTERYLRDLSFWPQLLQYNRIDDPQAIRPGSKLRIPNNWLRLGTAEVRIGEAQGEVQIEDHEQGEDWRPVATGQRLDAGQRLRTADNGSATLELAGGSSVLVRPGTELRLVQAKQPRARGSGPWLRIELLRGGLENVVQRRPGSGTRFEIQTPSAVAAVRGTEFRVSASADSSRSEVLGGAVAFGSSRGSVTLPRGTGSLAVAGQAPRPPIALLPAPGLGALPATVERLPISIPLTPVPGAQRYQTQLIPAGSALVASDESSATPNARARDVPDGNYLLRVRSVDANGLEGLQAERPLTVNARPEPPVLSSPAPDATIATPHPEFHWTEAGGAAGYRFQLAASQDFARLLVDQAVPGSAVAVDSQSLPPGLYHWRVATRATDGEQGPFSDAERLRLVPVPPQVDPATHDDKAMTLRWRAGEPGTTYRFQLARDAQFTDLLADRRVDTASVSLDVPPPGEYQLRVQTLTADGFEGAWSPPQKIKVEGKPVLWPLLLLIPFVFLL